MRPWDFLSPALSISRQFSEFSANNSSSNLTCLGNAWIWQYFGQCVTNDFEYGGFVIGFISLLFWMVPLFPQIYENYKRGSCEEALSIYFLLFWILGDTCNVSGAFLTHQLPSQIIIGVYYIIQDMVLLGQFVYYSVKNRSKRLAEKQAAPATVGRPSSTILRATFLVSAVGLMSRGGTGGYLLSSTPAAFPHEGIGGPILLRLLQGGGKLGVFFTGATDELGYVLGSVSALSYFAGRIPQLYKNYKRQSTVGVSLAMFVIIVLANFSYGLSVILCGIGSGLDYGIYTIRHLPWLAGSLGCCLCDTIVIAQFFRYAKNRIRADEDSDSDETGLINEVPDPNDV